jgi:hypothetical protein
VDGRRQSEKLEILKIVTLKYIVFFLFFIAFLSCNSPSPHVSIHMSNDSMPSTPAIHSPTKEIVCKLTSKELHDRKETVLELLKKEVKEKKELANGYSFKFDGSDEIFSQLTTFIQSERQCCNFFVFSLVVADTESAIWLTISGPQGTKEFIETEMGL